MGSHPQCQVCGLRSLSNEAHNAHQDTHPSCDRCGEVVVAEEDLARHLEVHRQIEEDDVETGAVASSAYQVIDAIT